MANQIIFRDRRDAGARLAAALTSYGIERPVVVALPRGGVPVGEVVARALGAPLDVCVVRKLGAPSNPELGIGAVAEGGFVYLNEALVEQANLSDADLARAVAVKQREVDARVHRFRRGAPALAIRGRTVIVVDDGIAMGGTARAAIRALRALEPRKLVLAVPVGAADSVESLRRDVSEVVCLLPVNDLVAVGEWYDDFAQVSDDEVIGILERARRERNEGR
jgi:putative phosphoribosyl transferase